MKRAVLTATCGLISLLLSATAYAELQAGAAAVDVSPQDLPVNLPGGFSNNIADEIHDSLFSRCLVLDDGTSKVALVVVDNLGVAPEVCEAAKQQAAAATDIPVERMMISSTHTHSAPASNVTEGSAQAKAYRPLLTDGIARSIIEAHAQLQPASLAVTKTELPDEVFNRRWYLKPGKMTPNPFGQMDIVRMNPPRRPDVLDRPAGPTDPEISVINVRRSNGRPLSLFANYSLHYVGGVPRGVVSADYYGIFAQLVPNRLRGDSDFVAMMSNGTSGDINNIPFGVTRPPRASFEQMQIVAQKAADAVWFALTQSDSEINYSRDVELAMTQRDITLEHRKVPPELLERARKIAALIDEKEIAKLPRLAQAYANRTIALAELPPTVSVRLQAIRIGDLAICCIPFETFVEIGLELKSESPFPETMVVGLANGRYGYLPTPEHHRLGGYETWLGTNKVQKDASVIIVRHLREMLDELHHKSTE